MKLGREIAGLARSIKYDLHHSRRARMYLIVAGFSLAAISTTAVAAGQMTGMSDNTVHEASDQTEKNDPASLTDQGASSSFDGIGAVTQGVKPSDEPDEPSPEPEPTTESGEWEQPTSTSPSSSPEPEPSPTTPSPEPSDPDSESPSPEPSDSDSPSPSETPSEKG